MMQNVRVILDRVATGPTAEWVIRIRAADMYRISSKNTKQIEARFGLNGSRVPWRVTKRKSKYTLFSIPIRLIQTETGWVLGPIIGILTSARDGTFGGNRFDHRDLSKVGKHTHTCVFVITPDTIRYDLSSVEGFVWTGLKKEPWMKIPMPVPDIVYNRIPNRACERDAKTQRAKSWLMEQNGGHLYNSRFFNKIELMRYLSQSNDTRSYLPRTEILKSRQQLSDWLKQTDSVYVKPANGTIGQGIIRIDRGDKGWTVKKQLKKEQTSRYFDELLHVTKHVTHSVSVGQFIIQEGIRLARWNGRMFDLRVLLQKDRKKRWKVTGLGARVAGRNKITTHVPNGGMIASARRVLRDVFRQRSDSIYEEIKKLTIDSANQIESNISNLAEMSMDIGVDENGKPWFIEANAKPMKFDEPSIRARSLLRIIHYTEGLYSS